MNIHSVPVAPADTGETLLDAGLVTFDALGYSATPVPAIAAQAGIAVGSVYRRFPSKEALANALSRREQQRLAAALFDGIEPQAPARETFTRIWERLAAYAVGHADALCFLELHHHGADLDPESAQLGRQTMGPAWAMLQRS